MTQPTAQQIRSRKEEFISTTNITIAELKRDGIFLICGFFSTVFLAYTTFYMGVWPLFVVDIITMLMFIFLIAWNTKIEGRVKQLKVDILTSLNSKPYRDIKENYYV